jgi:hypothetical protein
MSMHHICHACLVVLPLIAQASFLKLVTRNGSNAELAAFIVVGCIGAIPFCLCRPTTKPPMLFVFSLFLVILHGVTFILAHTAPTPKAVWTDVSSAVVAAALNCIAFKALLFKCIHSIATHMLATEPVLLSHAEPELASSKDCPTTWARTRCC